MDEVIHNNNKKSINARLFFGLNPPDNIKKQIHDFVSSIQLKEIENNHIKFVPQENYHATLLFIGSVDSTLKDSVILEAKKIKARNFSLNLNQLGHFKRSKALWLGSRTIPVELDHLQKNLVERFSSFFHNSKNSENHLKIHHSFSMHVTILKRLMDLNYISNLAPIYEQLKTNIFDKWLIEDFELMQSNIVDNQVEYETIEKFKLI